MNPDGVEEESISVTMSPRVNLCHHGMMLFSIFDFGPFAMMAQGA